MANYQYTKELLNNTLEVKVSGNLSISSMAALQDQLSALLEEKHDISLNLNKVEDADVTLFQLIESLKKTAKNQAYTININLPKDIELLYKRAGLLTLNS